MPTVPQNHLTESSSEFGDVAVFSSGESEATALSLSAQGTHATA